MLEVKERLKERMTGEKRPRCPLNVVTSKRFCGKCGTFWGFEACNGRDVNIQVFRPFIHSHGVCHPAWYNQVALPDEFEDLELEWKVDAIRSQQSPLTRVVDFWSSTVSPWV